MLEMNLFDTVDLLTSCCEPLLYLAMKSACLQGVRVVAHELLAAMQKAVRHQCWSLIPRSSCRTLFWLAVRSKQVRPLVFTLGPK